MSSLSKQVGPTDAWDPPIVREMTYTLETRNTISWHWW